ncbi:MAG: ROK family protein [Tenericutes bacterium]|nr:ROK family protein [Mycoplasmatota bacterium]
MRSFKYSCKPKIISELDPSFRPIALANAKYLEAVMKSDHPEPVTIAIERDQGIQSIYKTFVFNDSQNQFGSNAFYIERLVKSLLWIKGGWKIIFGGPKSVGEYLKQIYKKNGLLEFDRAFMSRIYEKDFVVEVTTSDQIKESNETSKPLGRHLDGYRIGFDAGGSDRKVSAVIDGVPIYSEEVIWHPKLQEDPNYHYQGILESMKTAASKMPRVEAIGVSAAGVYINNRVMAASLFIKVPEDLFDIHVKDMFKNIAKEFGDVPIVVANDGDVTALAGSMSLEANQVLGIAMGTSQAAGYVDQKGNITGWLNELAFVPVDYHINAQVDEWSLDFGCGVKYFSQDAVIKLARYGNLEIDPSLSPAEKLKHIQYLLGKGNEIAKQIFDTIGIYLGYSIAYYADFYDINKILILGRVTSGEGGLHIIKNAKQVLETEFPKLAKQIQLTLPDEKNRRVGQSVAAASLPIIKDRK